MLVSFNAAPDLTYFKQRADEINQDLMSQNLALTQLHNFNVSLDPDPVAQGLSSINAKIAHIQLNKDALCQIMFNVIDLKNTAENLVTDIEKFVNQRKSEVSDKIPGLNEMKNQAMRDTAIAKELKEENEVLSQITQLSNSCKNNFNKVRAQLDNLESTNQNIKKQLETVGYQINIGEISHKG